MRKDQKQKKAANFSLICGQGPQRKTVDPHQLSRVLQHFSHFAIDVLWPWRGTTIVCTTESPSFFFVRLAWLRHCGTWHSKRSAQEPNFLGMHETYRCAEQQATTRHDEYLQIFIRFNSSADHHPLVDFWIAQCNAILFSFTWCFLKEYINRKLFTAAATSPRDVTRRIALNASRFSSFSFLRLYFPKRGTS